MIPEEMKLYIVDSESNEECFVRNFLIFNRDVLPVINWVKYWLIEEAGIEYERICSYVNDENNDEFVILYGGQMYFLLRRS